MPEGIGYSGPVLAGGDVALPKQRQRTVAGDAAGSVGPDAVAELIVRAVDDQGMTFKELADRFGMTAKQVQQMYEVARGAE